MGTHRTKDSGGNAAAALKLSAYYATWSFTRRKCNARARRCNGKSSRSLNRPRPRCEYTACDGARRCKHANRGLGRDRAWCLDDCEYIAIINFTNNTNTRGPL